MVFSWYIYGTLIIYGFLISYTQGLVPFNGNYTNTKLYFRFIVPNDFMEQKISLFELWGGKQFALLTIYTYGLVSFIGRHIF